MKIVRDNRKRRVVLKYTLGLKEKSEVFQKVRGLGRAKTTNLPPHLYYSCNSYTNYVRHLKNWKNDHIQKNEDVNQNSSGCQNPDDEQMANWKKWSSPHLLVRGGGGSGKGRTAAFPSIPPK